MTPEEFVKSLTPEQNAALIAYRDSINAMRDEASQKLVEVHAQQLSDAKAATDVALSARTESDAARAVAEKRNAELESVNADTLKAKKLESAQAQLKAAQSAIDELTKADVAAASIALEK